MKSRNSGRAVTYVAATLAAIGCLCGCGTVPYGASGNDTGSHAKADTNGHANATATAPAGDQAAATADARRVLSGLVVPAGTRRLPQEPAPAGLSEPAQTMSADRSVDLYRLYRVSLPAESTAAFLRAHLPAGLVVDSTGQVGTGQVGTGQVGATAGAAATLLVTATPRRLPAGIYALELVDTIVPAGSGSSWLRADVQVIWYPARSGAENSVPTSYRSVRVVASSGQAGRAITTSSRSVLDALEALLTQLPAAPAAIRECPAITVSYDLTLEPARGGQPPVVISTGGCAIDNVSIGGRQQPALWDQGDKVFLLARSLLGPQGRLGWVSPPGQACHLPEAQTTLGSRPCLLTPTPAPA